MIISALMGLLSWRFSWQRFRVEGQSLKDVGFRQRFGLTVVALKRLNRSYRTDVGDIQLTLGDALLVVGTPQQIRAVKQSADFIVIEPNPSDQPVYARQVVVSTGITMAAIVASIAGFPVYLSMLIGALLIVLLGVLSMEEAYQSIEWQAIFLNRGNVCRQPGGDPDRPGRFSW